MTQRTREHLIWSWNYDIAEAMTEDTTRHNAQSPMHLTLDRSVVMWIVRGIPAGKDQTDADLIGDFLCLRCLCQQGSATVEQVWEPTPKYNGLTWLEMLADLRTFPGFDDILKEVEEEQRKGNQAAITLKEVGR